MLNIKASEECLEQYESMKLKHKIAYLIMRVQGGKDQEKIECTKVATKEEAGNEYLPAFIADIKEAGSCSYGIVDWNNKLLFVHWVPGTSKAKDKMIYASIKEAFIQSLVGIQLKIQCADDAELNVERIENETKSNV